jgi:PAS domain S-box-containing protein
MFLVAVVEERRQSEETLRESERRLAGNLAITRILAESPALSDATPRILQTMGQALGWDMGAMWAPDAEGNLLRCLKVWHAPAAKVDQFASVSREYTFAPGVGLPGRVWKSLKPAWIADVSTDDNFPRAPFAVAQGLRAAFAFPLLFGENFLGVMEFFSHEIREPDDALLAMFASIGSQIGQFMERKWAEESLLKNREALKLAHKIARGGTWQYDLVTNTVDWSEEYYELLGLSPGEVPASFEEWSRRVYPDDLSAVLKEHENAIAEKRDVNIEFRIQRADLEWRWFKRTGRCVYGADGRPLSMIGITFDITERKHAEEALRQSEEQLRLALEAANMGAWEYEVRSEAVKWSSNLEAIHGLAPGSFGGTFDDFRKEIHPEDRQNVLESLARSIEDGAQHEIEYRIIRPDGTIRWLEGKGQVIRDGTGKAVRMTGLCVDITERKCAEEEREQLLRNEHAARAEAEAANRTKDEFLALLSHELRTPLVAILGWATTLMATPQPDEALTARALETIKRNARLQTRIIEDMLDVSRIVTGKLQLDIRPVDLPSIIEAAIATVQPTADTKGVRLQLTLDSAIGPVSGDPHRLQQVVWNLLSNAIKFTPSGGLVEIRLKESGSKAEITVSDTGEGIPTEFLPHIFDRFRQANSSTTRKHGGLGLGLAIVRHLVELQGGTVAAYSAGEDRGSLFTITLPCVTTHPVVPLEQHHLEDGRRLESTIALTGLRILYVEDDTDSREALAAVLLLYGAAVKSVATVPEALDVLTGWKPDVLVSDIGLPHEDGYDLIRQLRAREPGNGGTVPAIALTGYAGAHENERALSAGYQMYLAKPVEPGRLAEIITSLVEKDGKPYRGRASASPTVS